MADENPVGLSLEQGIAILTLQREKQLNALNRELLLSLSQHLETLAALPELRVVVLQGAGRAFAAGADIGQMQNLSAVEATAFAKLGQQVFRQLELLPQPTLALIQGYALGGGLELAMACDIRMAAEGTRFGQPEVSLGVIPGFGGTQRLPRLVGRGNALRWLLSGELLEAQQALAIGLVTDVVAPAELLDRGRALAEKLAQLAPQALASVKRAVDLGSGAPLEQGLNLEAALFGLCFATVDQQEGMTAFLAKRKPVFSGK
ncbi:crotonase [Alicyclobacillaceae bacterium I2511]|nr:crotonase [Alicyclobacillaceae bacterium I2511]